MPKETSSSKEEYEAKLRALREALIEGEESGPARPFDFDAFLKRMRAEYEAKRRKD